MAAPKNNINAAGNKGGGRQTEYNAEYAKQVTKLARLGATDKEIADFFEVTERTINNWKKTQIEFISALKKGKLIADANVAQCLYKRATGYNAKDVDIKVIEGKIVKTDLVKHYPPDVTAQIFWLKNRQREKWRDKQDLTFDFEKMDVSSLDYIINELEKRAK